MIPQKVKIRAIELRAGGASYASIAKELSIAKQTAVDILREKPEEIATLRAIELEALYETERVSNRGRIEQLSALHTRLRQEIEGRDLADVPTEKLISLYLKTSDTLKGEVTAPVIQSTTEQNKAASDRELFSF